MLPVLLVRYGINSNQGKLNFSGDDTNMFHKVARRMKEWLHEFSKQLPHLSKVMKRQKEHTVLDLGFANIQPVQNDTPNIKVIGIGGGGGNAINRMVDAGVAVSNSLLQIQIYRISTSLKRPTNFN